MVPTVGIFIASYIVMRSLLVLRDACAPEGSGHRILGAMTTFAAIVAFALASFGTVELINSSQHVGQAMDHIGELTR